MADGHHVYRSSSLGSCDKALVAARLGYQPRDPPDNFLGYYARGNQTELDVIDWLHGNDYKIRDQQLEVVIDCPLDARIVGHIDGVFTSPQGVDYVGEIKRMSTPAFEEFMRGTWQTAGLVQKYKWQFSSYMVALRLPGLFVVREGLSEEQQEKGLQPRTRIVEVPQPFYDRTDLVRRVVELELLARKGLPEGCVNPSYPCPYFYLHEEENSGLLPTANTGPVREAVDAYRSAQMVAATAKTGLDEARRGLVAAMAGARKVELGNGTTVVRFQKKNPWRWDEEKMREDGVEVEKYRSQTVSEQIRVTGDSPSVT